MEIFSLKAIEIILVGSLPHLPLQTSYTFSWHSPAQGASLHWLEEETPKLVMGRGGEEGNDPEERSHRRKTDLDEELGCQ